MTREQIFKIREECYEMHIEECREKYKTELDEIYNKMVKVARNPIGHYFIECENNRDIINVLAYDGFKIVDHNDVDDRKLIYW